jgi:hypothetical protein
MPPARTAATLAALSISAALVSGCHVSVHAGNGPAPAPSSTSVQAQPAVPKGDLEQITAQQVRDQTGGGPVVINCPGDLPIKLGAVEHCTLAQDGKHFDIAITITKAESPNNATWDWQVGKQLFSPT